MNANELADKCDEVFVLVEYDAIKQAATMLRQQQAEIEALKRKLQEAIDCAESEIDGGGINWYAYATEWKAILRKAQEK